MAGPAHIGAVNVKKMSNKKLQRTAIVNMAAIQGPHLQHARALIQEQGHIGPVKDSGAKELEGTMEDKHMVIDTKPKPRKKLTSSLPETLRK